jgi:hypothetical protein
MQQQEQHGPVRARDSGSMMDAADPLLDVDIRITGKEFAVSSANRHRYVKGFHLF